MRAAVLKEPGRIEMEERPIPTPGPGDVLIRVNRLPAAADQPLAPGDRVSFTPVKIEGAAA